MSSEMEKNWLDRMLKNKRLPELLAKTGSITAVPIDQDLTGATVGQAWLILKGVPDLNPQLTDAVSFRANAVGIKLNALRYHCKRYQAIQAKRIAEFSASVDMRSALQRGVKITELDMLYEVEAFFSQYKSSLDMLVKIFCPITGLTPGSLSTYGDYGGRIVKTLQNLKKNKSLNLTAGRIDWLIEEIEKTKPWLKSVITVRDTYSHYRPEIHFGFGWDLQAEKVQVPQSEVDSEFRALDSVMVDLTESLINYASNFIAIAISCVIPLSTGMQVMDEMDKRYIGARWDMNLSRATWKISSNVIRFYTEEDIENARRMAKQASGEEA